MEVYEVKTGVLRINKPLDYVAVTGKSLMTIQEVYNRAHQIHVRAGRTEYTLADWIQREGLKVEIVSESEFSSIYALWAAADSRAENPDRLNCCKCVIL